MQWVQRRLRNWSDWARGNRLTNSAHNPIAAMIQIAAGEMPGRDLSQPHDMSLEIEITDKAVAVLRQHNPKGKRLIMRYWLGRTPVFEIATDLRVSDERAKEMLHRAEAQLGRHILDLEERLTISSQGRTIGFV